MKGRSIFRVDRNDMPVVYGEDLSPILGTAHTVRDGTNATGVAFDIIVSKAVEAAAELEKEGISTRVLDLHTNKPFDRDALLKAAGETGAIVTAEAHSIIGGLGRAVAEAIAEDVSAVMRRVGVNDQFAS